MKIYQYVLVAFLAGCANIPEIKTINFEVLPESNTVEKWWNSFQDENLNKLMSSVLKNNTDIKVAEYNLEKSNEAISLSEVRKYPQLTFDANTQRVKIPALKEFNFNGEMINFVQLGLKTKYVFDLYGQTDYSLNEQKFKKEALEFNQKTIEINLSVQVLKLYVYWQYLNEEKIIVENQKQLMLKLKENNKYKVRQGYLVTSDLLELENTLQNLEITLLEIQTNQKHIENSLSILSMNEVVLSRSDILEKAQDLKPINVDSNVIINRPEVSYYLNTIYAAKEHLNLLKTEFYPSISLSGQYGLQKIGFSDLFNASNIFAMIGPSFSLPVFNAGQIKSDYKIGAIDLNIAIIKYNEAVMKSFYEINDNVFKTKNGFATLQNQNTIFNNEYQKLHVMEQKLELGKISNNDLLSTQIDFETQKRTKLNNTLNYFNEYVDLINAMGK